MDNCTTCCRRFQSHFRKIMCCVCKNEFHIKCVTLSPEGIQQIEENYTNWFCQTCTTEIFPFNKIEDDLDFLSAMKDMCMSSQQSFSYLSEKRFIPFELNDNDHGSGLSDVDPDLNFFSGYNQVGAKCNYYLESSFNEDLAKNKCAKDVFSVCHANIRSVSKNLSSLESYLKMLKHEFTILGLTETWLQNENNDLYSLNGYHFIGKHRVIRGGGVLQSAWRITWLFQNVMTFQYLMMNWNLSL